MIKTILFVILGFLGLALAFALLLAARQPDRFRVQRTATIEGAPDKLYPLINDMRQFNTWNPYNLKDPNIKGTYQGPAAGPGATYLFEGNKDVGSGSLEIVEAAAPARVTMKLVLLTPFESRNTVEFTLVPRGAATDVTWAMHGPSHFIAKFAGLFFNMDGMIGRDMEAGLANLRAKAGKA